MAEDTSLETFQFQTGSIKSGLEDEDGCAEWGFNSKLVRLKVTIVSWHASAPVGFNSKLVRLKVF